MIKGTSIEESPTKTTPRVARAGGLRPPLQFQRIRLIQRARLIQVCNARPPSVLILRRHN